MRKNITGIAYIVVGLALLVVSLQSADASQRRRAGYSAEETEVIRNTYPAPTGAQRGIEVDNIFGSVEVVGTNTEQVQLVVTKTIYAETDTKLATAQKEVTLDVKNDGETLVFFVNGPFRCNCNDGCGGRWGHDPGYTVKMDFRLEVPQRMRYKVKTVNDGHIKVQNVAGDFIVRNVNGGITMTDVAGSGSATTVNGPVKVTFRENPKTDSEFKSINGAVELAFARSLSADFRFKTMNGGIYTDFPMTGLPQQAVTPERKNGRFVYRSDRFTGGRVGSGGPEIKIENLNGDIRVLERSV